MIAEFLPGSYDEGFAISHPRKKHPFFRPTFPLGLYMTHPLEHICTSFEDMLAFLRTCRYKKDEDEYGRQDYWAPPDVFEKHRKGDCDCFAAWAWRQLTEMGYDARFVVGYYGDSACHAWTSFEKDGHYFLLDPTLWPAGLSMPRLRTVFYRPWISAKWDSRKIYLYEHEDTSEKMPVLKMLPYLPEWTAWEARLYGRVGRGMMKWAASRGFRRKSKQK